MHVCIKKCFFGGRLFRPGEKVVFAQGAKVPSHFALPKDVPPPAPPEEPKKEPPLPFRVLGKDDDAEEAADAEAEEPVKPEPQEGKANGKPGRNR